MRIKDALQNVLHGSVLILGVGNIDKGDDGAGSTFVQKINGRVSATCIDAGVAPENFLEKIVAEQPDTVLIVDATDFGGDPGEIRIFDPARISAGGLSTHALSLDMACQYLNDRINVKIYLLAIQPVQIKSEGLSPVVAASLESLENTLLAVCPASG